MDQRRDEGLRHLIAKLINDQIEISNRMNVGDCIGRDQRIGRLNHGGRFAEPQRPPQLHFDRTRYDVEPPYQDGIRRARAKHVGKTVSQGKVQAKTFNTVVDCVLQLIQGIIAVGDDEFMRTIAIYQLKPVVAQTGGNVVKRQRQFHLAHFDAFDVGDSFWKHHHVFQRQGVHIVRKPCIDIEIFGLCRLLYISHDHVAAVLGHLGFQKQWLVIKVFGIHPYTLS